MKVGLLIVSLLLRLHEVAITEATTVRKFGANELNTYRYDNPAEWACIFPDPLQRTQKQAAILAAKTGLASNNLPLVVRLDRANLGVYAAAPGQAAPPPGNIAMTPDTDDGVWLNPDELCMLTHHELAATLGHEATHLGQKGSDTPPLRPTDTAEVKKVLTLATEIVKKRNELEGYLFEMEYTVQQASYPSVMQSTLNELAAISGNASRIFGEEYRCLIKAIMAFEAAAPSAPSGGTGNSVYDGIATGAGGLLGWAGRIRSEANTLKDRRDQIS